MACNSNCKQWSKEEIAFVKENYLTMTVGDIAKKLNRTKPSIRAKAKKVFGKLTEEQKKQKRMSVYTPEFRKKIGDKSRGNPNLIRNFIVAGQMSNVKPIGTEILDRDGYVHVKVSDTPYQYKKNWIPKARYIWELNCGPIEKGYQILFLDGDKLNFSLDNLCIISTRAIATVCHKYKLVNDKEINLEIIRTAILRIKIQDIKKGRIDELHRVDFRRAKDCIIEASTNI